MDERISYRKLAELTEGRDARMREAISRTVSDINRAEEAIRDGVANVLRRAGDITARLDEGRMLNELGEFQSQPVEVDRHIAQLCQAQRMLVALVGAETAQALLGSA